MNTIRQKITTIFKECLEVEVIDETSTLADLGADSLDEIGLLINVEAAFDIEFDFNAWEKCITFAEYVSLAEVTVAGKI